MVSTSLSVFLPAAVAFGVDSAARSDVDAGAEFISDDLEQEGLAITITRNKTNMYIISIIDDSELV